uniref:Cytochrome P450 n=1 Tax=Panagrolaimus sp. JU765 TaxID=591449 RepID=A0AC34Q4R4_9BILA
MFWFLVGILLVSFVYYYFVYYHVGYFKRRGIPTAPIKEPFWNHLNYFIDRETPFYYAYDKWTEKFGKVFGFFLGWRRVLMISDLEMAQDVLYRQYDNFDQRMVIPLERLDHLWDRRYIMNATGNKYRRIRSLVVQCFTPAMIRKVTPKINDAAKSFVKILKEKVENESGPIVVQRHVLEYVMDMLCRLVLGTQESLQFKNPYVNKVEQLMGSYSRTPVQRFSYLCTPFNTFWIPFYEAYNYFFPDHRMQMITDLFVKVTQRKKIRDELAEKGQRVDEKDFIDVMIDAEDNSVEDSKFKKQLTPKEVIINCAVLVNGGLETTSNAAISSICALAKYPQYQQSLYEEIMDSIDENSSENMFDQLKNMKLLDSFIKEVLRLNPSAPQTINRRTVNTTTIGNGKQKVEKGTYVFVNIRALQRNPEIWGDDASEFKPERFFDLTPEQNNAFLAFGGGPKICPGILLANVAIKLMIIHLLKDKHHSNNHNNSAN